MFTVGSKVEARMPGTRLYSSGEVVETKGSSYVIKFDNGSVHPVSDRFLRPVSKMEMRKRRTSRSPARTRVSQRASIRPGEETFPNVKPETKTKTTRSPSRSAKSPSRTQKSPSRVQRSPSRVQKSPSRATKSPSRIDKIQNQTTTSKTEVYKIITRRKIHSSQNANEEVQDDKELERSLKQSTPVEENTETLSVPKDWSERKKVKPAVMLCDILQTSRSNSRQSSSSYTNSELGAIEQSNLVRDSPNFTETDFLSSDIEETLTQNKTKYVSRVYQRSSRMDSRTPDLDNVNLLNIQSDIHKKELTPIKKTLTSEVSDHDDEAEHIEEKHKEKEPIMHLMLNNIMFRFIKFLIITSLIASAPLICLYMYSMCSPDACTFEKPRLELLKNFKTYYSLNSSFMFVTFFWMISILSVIRVFGTTIYGFPNKDGILKYYFNGIFSALILSVSIILLYWYKIPILRYVHEQDFKLLIASISCAFLLSFALFLRSYFIPIASLNLSGYSGNSLLDFWFGRELNPRIFSIFDIKIIHYRMSILGTIILLLAYAYDDCRNLITNLLGENDNDYNSTLVTVFVLNVLFHIDLLIHEKQLVATLQVQHDGTGFMILLKNSIYPFFMAFTAKYILYQNVRVPLTAQCATILVFVTGYALFRYSNNAKFAIRTNSTDSRFHFKDLYITYSGKKLLLAKTWGFVRHPNYLGHIIILFSIFFPLLWVTHLPAICFSPCVICVLFLMHRATRDNYLCEKKHGSSWMRYCGVVRYKIVPHVF